jgi:phage-related minor tail protein
MAKTLVGALRVTLGLDSAEFASGAAKAEARSGKLRKSMLGIGVAAAGVATAMASLSGAIRRALNTADDMGKAAAKFGLPVEQLSRLKYAADLSDVSLETLGTSLGQLSKKMVAAGEGGQTQAKMFADMGVKVLDANGQLRDTEAVLQDVADVFATMPDGPQKTALAMEVFGKAGAQMIPLLNAGKTGLQAMAEEANKLGLVIDEKTAKSAESFNDNLTRLGAAAGGLVLQLAAALAPALERMSEILVSLSQSFAALSPETKEMIGQFLAILAPVAAAAAVFGLLSLAISPVALTIAAIATAALLIYENWDGIAQWFSDIWTSIKTSTGEAWEFIKSSIGGAIDYVTQKWQAFIDLLLGAVEKAKAAGRAIADALSTGRAEMNSGSGYGGMGGAAGDDPAAGMGLDSYSITPGSAVTSGRSISGGLAFGIRQGAVDVMAAVTEVSAAADAKIRSDWQIASPSRLTAQYGQNIGEGLAEGVRQSTGIVGQAVEALNTTASGAMQGIGDLGAQIGDMFASAATNVLTGVQSLQEAVGQLLQQLAQMLINSAMKSLFANMFGGLGGGIGLPGYASGTMSAAAGWAMVGEEGPELVRMRGGERVFDAGRTGRMMEGGANGGGPVQVTTNVYLDSELIRSQIETVEGEAAVGRVIRKLGY